MPSDASSGGIARCQHRDCSDPAKALIQSRESGIELHLCRDCVSGYHEEGWKKIRGNVELVK